MTDLPPGEEPSRGLLDDRWSLGVSFYEAGRFHESLDVFEAFLSEDPENPYVLHNIGRCLFALGEEERAVEVLRRAVQSKSDEVGNLRLLAVILASAGNLDEAEEVYEALVGMSPGEEEDLLESALIQGRQGDYAEAMRMLSGPAGEKADNRGAFFFLRGVRSYGKGDLDAAQAAFRLALAVDSGYYLARLSLGVVTYQTGDAQGAVVELRKALALRDDDPDLYRYLGLAYERIGDQGTALEFFRRSNEMLAGGLRTDNLRNLSLAGLAEGGVDEGLPPLFRSPCGGYAAAADSAVMKVETVEVPSPTAVEDPYSDAEGEKSSDPVEVRLDAVEYGLEGCRSRILAMEEVLRERDAQVRDLAREIRRLQMMVGEGEVK